MHFPSCYKNADSLWMSRSPKSALRHKESSFAQSYALFPGDGPYPVIAKYGGAKAHPPVSIGNSSDGSPSPRSPVRQRRPLLRVHRSSTSHSAQSCFPQSLPSVIPGNTPPQNCLHKILPPCLSSRRPNLREQEVSASLHDPIFLISFLQWPQSEFSLLNNHPFFESALV